MWFLKKLDGTSYPLYTKSVHIIGRFGGLELADDASVSRRHASVTITLKDGTAKFVLEDLGSKYGTFLNEGIESVNTLPTKTSIEINVGDRIKFGLQANIWTLIESRFMTCTSNLTSHQKKTTLKGILDNFEGDIVSDWNEYCTHLTTPEIRTTIKVICAAAQVKPIVSLDYWQRLSAAFFGSVETPLPDCDDFVPPISEPQIKSSLINLKMNKNRRSILKGLKCFVFDAAQMKTLLPIVEAAGGTVVDGTNRSFKINETELCQENVIVVQGNEVSARITRIKNILNSRNLRLISDTEIYLSIFECSTERHCNPKYDAAVLFRSDSDVMIKEEPTILANATQDPQFVQETQFLETASGSFALEVDARLASDSDDDIIPGTDPSIIRGTLSDSPAPKRKLPSSETGVKRKSARLDSWLTKKESNDSGESVASESLFPSSAKTTKKSFKDLFSFRASKNETNKASSNLLDTNDSRPQAEPAPNKKPESRSSSLFTTNKSQAGDQKVSRTAGLFANASGPRVTRASNRFSDSQEPSTSKNMSIGKRKFVDEVDSESRSSSRTATLFKKRAKRPTMFEDSDSDAVDDVEIPKTSKLAVDEAPIYQDSPVDVPSKMSMSQFQGAPARENVTVKTVNEDFSPIKQKHDRSVICTAPLVLRDNAPNIPRPSVNTSVTNFKKFRKNQVCYPTTSLPNITKLTLISDGAENGFHDD